MIAEPSNFKFPFSIDRLETDLERESNYVSNSASEGMGSIRSSFFITNSPRNDVRFARNLHALYLSIPSARKQRRRTPEFKRVVK